MRTRVHSVAAAVVMSVWAGGFANAQTPDEKTLREIEEVLELNNSRTMGSQLATVIHGQMLALLRARQSTLPDRASPIVKEILDGEFSRMFAGADGVTGELTALYTKIFTPSEITSLLEFLRSPVGRKLGTVTPTLNRESTLIGQRWAQANMPRISSLVEERLRGEGLLVASDQEVFTAGSAGVMPPKLTKQVRPQYTQGALGAKIQGSVRLSAVVLPDGTVGEVTVTRSLDAVYGLDLAAVTALKQWTFSPGTKDGQPVPVRVNVDLTFNVKEQ